MEKQNKTELPPFLLGWFFRVFADTFMELIRELRTSGEAVNRVADVTKRSLPLRKPRQLAFSVNVMTVLHFLFSHKKCQTQPHEYAYWEDAIDATRFPFGVRVPWDGSTGRDHGVRSFAAALESLLHKKEGGHLQTNQTIQFPAITIQHPDSLR